MIQILIVDDHAILRRGLKEILEREFRDVSIGGAGTAEQALTQLDSEKWDLVILDITMPGRSGVDVLRNLKALAQATHPRAQHASGGSIRQAGAESGRIWLHE
jgi:two-component system invasion response regulator UvrY